MAGGDESLRPRGLRWSFTTYSVVSQFVDNLCSVAGVAAHMRCCFSIVCICFVCFFCLWSSEVFVGAFVFLKGISLPAKRRLGTALKGRSSSSYRSIAVKTGVIFRLTRFSKLATIPMARETTNERVLVSLISTHLSIILTYRKTHRPCAQVTDDAAFLRENRS